MCFFYRDAAPQTVLLTAVCNSGKPIKCGAAPWHQGKLKAFNKPAGPGREGKITLADSDATEIATFYETHQPHVDPYASATLTGGPHHVWA